MPDRSERLVPGRAPVSGQASIPGRWRRFFRRKAGTDAETAASRRGDWTVAALGVTLGLLCATFPWYIFMNPEKFGTEGTAFRIVPGFGSGRATVSPTVPRQGPFKEPENLPADLDLFATATAPEEEEKPAPPPEQPFPPAAPPVFHLVHIENGRAMVEDDSGLFLVGPGDRLPDGSRVTGFTERDGKPVLTTTTDEVLGVEE